MIEAAPPAVAAAPITGEHVISTQALVKRFRDIDAVAGIDLRVPAGGIYGFLGPNGAGKTTTIRILLGLIRPTRGVASLFGEPVRPGSANLDRVGALVERPAFYPYLSATDNLWLLGRSRGIPESRLRTAVPEALSRVGMSEAAKRKAGRYSTGMRQRLGIAAALLGRPDLVVLDEPANGLDPNGVVDVRELIAGLGKDGITVFLSSHVLPEVEQLCDRVAILQRGRIVAEGKTQAMLQQGERLHVRFETDEDAARARPILESAWPGDAVAAGTGGGTVTIRTGSPSGAEVIRLLAGHQLFPAEVANRRQSLESVFIELTGDHEVQPPGSPATPAAPGAGPGASAPGGEGPT